LFGYLKAEFKITFISAVIVLIGLLILGVEHALTIALIIWLIDFLPYIGAIIIFLPCLFFAFSLGYFFFGPVLTIFSVFSLFMHFQQGIYFLEQVWRFCTVLSYYSVN